MHWKHVIVNTEDNKAQIQQSTQPKLLVVGWHDWPSFNDNVDVTVISREAHSLLHGGKDRVLHRGRISFVASQPTFHLYVVEAYVWSISHTKINVDAQITSSSKKYNLQ
jgi:hypothetical protein